MTETSVVRQVAQDVIRAVARECTHHETRELFEEELLRPALDALCQWMTEQLRLNLVHAILLLSVWTLAVAFLLFLWSWLFLSRTSSL